MEPVISVKNVTKIYRLYNSNYHRLAEALSFGLRKNHRELKVLDNISFDAMPGEIIGVVGKNGAGKSTLLKIISKIIPPTDGEVSIKGRINALIEMGAGLNPEFSARQNIQYFGSIKGISKEQMPEFTAKIIEFAELEEFANQQLKIYSSGMKARLSFALATQMDPDILLLDEVFAVGDITFKRKSYKVIENIVNQNKTIFLVSHSSDAILKMCTRALLLENGEIIMDDRPGRIMPIYSYLSHIKGENRENYVRSLKEQTFDELQINYNREDGEKYDPDNSIFKGNSSLPKFSELQEYFEPSLHLKEVHAISPFKAAEYMLCDLLNAKGDRVNVLVYGREYAFQLRFKALKEVELSGFVIKFKTIEGITATVVKMAMPENLKFPEKDSLVELQTNFKCELGPGKYFIDISVFNKFGEQQRICLQLIDGYFIHVQQYAECDFKGFFKLQTRLQK